MGLVRVREPMRVTLRLVRRVVVGVIGGTVLALGLVLVVMPGPAFVVIPTGLAILALEFAWARRWLHHVRELANGARRSRSRKNGEERRDPE
jgi:tellurite resistance protein TerC